MTAHVLHVGEDYWHRVPVLRGAGLSVGECKDIHELAETLRTGTEHHAVLLAESPVFDPRPATEIVRTTVSCPVVLFATAHIVAEPARYDLIVPPLTDPVDWLEEIRALIDRSRQIRADSRATGVFSAQLRQEAEALRRRSREQRERSERLIHADGILRKVDGE